MISIPWYFMDKLNKASEFGMYYMLIGFVTLFWGLYAGTIVDRFNRKLVFLCLNVAGFLVLGTVTASGFILGDLPEALVVTVFACTFFIYNLHYPSLYAFMQEITERRQYSRITSYLEIQGQFTSMLAGAVSVILLEGTNGGAVTMFGKTFQTGIDVAPWKLHEIFALDAATYALSFIIIASISYTSLVERNIDLSPLVKRIRNGLDFLKKNPLIFIFGNASYFVFVTTLIIGFYLMAVYVSGVLQAKGDAYATGEMLFAMGSLFAGIMTQRIFRRIHAVDGIIFLSMISASVFFMLFLTKDSSLFFIGAFLLGLSNAGIRIQRVTFLFRVVPNDVIGRSSSVFFIINTLFRLLFIGLLFMFFAEPDKVPYAMLMLGLFITVGAGILFVNRKPLKILDDEEDERIEVRKA
jgi:MFS family permease